MGLGRHLMDDWVQSGVYGGLSYRTIAEDA